jgi:hypothetical protein
MGMTGSEPAGGFAIWIARCCAVALGLIAVAWGISVLAFATPDYNLASAAKRIRAGQDFSAEALAHFIPIVERAERSPICQPAAIRDAAILRLRDAELAVATGQRTRLDPTIDALRKTVTQALSCEPTDSFLWLVLYWIETTQNGFSGQSLSYLAMSYRFGRFEGWIAAKRTEFALRAFADLPPDLSEMVVDEFAHLLDSGFMNETIAALTGPGWPIRNRLLAGISKVGQVHRREFARELLRRGYRVSVPGIELEPRPWN